MDTAPAVSSVVDLVRLEPTGRDVFRAPAAPGAGRWLYGGQLAAQALMAAGNTVDADRVPHSLHGYFLRSGDGRRPMQLRVTRDRDGSWFSARRVEVSQDGAVLFAMAASFHRRDEGVDRQVDPAPTASAPETAQPVEFPHLVSMECRSPEQPYPQAFLPTRYWARCTGDVGGSALVHAVLLTYLSDMPSGLMALEEGQWRPSQSLDHAVWFHRPIRLDEWVLVDLVPRSAAGGRGWYTGTIHTRDGVLGASIAQEALFGRTRG